VIEDMKEGFLIEMMVDVQKAGAIEETGGGLSWADVVKEGCGLTERVREDYPKEMETDEH